MFWDNFNRSKSDGQSFTMDVLLLAKPAAKVFWSLDGVDVSGQRANRLTSSARLGLFPTEHGHAGQNQIHCAGGRAVGRVV